MISVCLVYLGVSVWLGQSQVQVNESDGMIEICAWKSLETIGSLTLNIEPHNGSAFGNKIHYAAVCLLTFKSLLYHPLPAGSDYIVIVPMVTIPATQLQACFTVDIIDDTLVEEIETFFVHLAYSGSANVLEIAPSTVEVTILG